MRVSGLAAGVVFAGLVGPAFAVNKCTAKDGSISFQDAPCSTAAQSQESVRVREQGTISSAGSYGLGPLDLTGSSDQRLVRIAAAVENLADWSSDCKIKLQVYGRAPNSSMACGRFLAHYQAWWSPSVAAMSELMKNDSWAGANIRTIEKVTSFMRKIRENSEFIALRSQAD